MQLSVKPGIPLSLFSNLLPHLCYLSVLSAAIENSTGKDSSKELSSHQLAFQNFILLPLPQNEYHDNIGDVDGPEEKERAQAKIQKFILAF
ncbi:hypothetical protein CK203_029553 [Vitis vinifera]|uniref:Uncharacterized protein n=1 Tax=Vitis vinifera TaxID=29760 RepID=A0A438JCB1_VITVI|nr:hypothetical protein CK203_029553 [Vitis vinifera]